MLSVRKLNLFPIVLSLPILLTSSGFAALGGDVSSVQADQAQMKAQRRVTQTNAYAVHEMQAETGTMVREFVSPQGKVFGVSWQGPARPNLQQLLGPYYEEYNQNAPTRRSHGPVTIQTPNMVIQFGGHQRALTGRAFVPGMVPSGVRVEEIK
jgi:hypothetical protein